MGTFCRMQFTRHFHSGLVRLQSRASPELDSIIRVDHAGELGADRIYAGQMAILGNTKSGPIIKHMWEQEKVHKAKFEELIRKYRVRPTAFVPIWNVAGFVLGAGTALMGEKAAMACTVAVESVIIDHYNDQLRTLMSDPTANKELLETIQKFRDDEQEHHDCGLEHDAEQAPLYEALTQVIKVGCKAAIAISKNFLQAPQVNMNPAYRSYSTQPVLKEKWDLLSAICLERKPVITRQINELEARYLKVLTKIENENSHKSDHEVRHERDLKNLELLKVQETLDLDVEASVKQTAQDFEDACLEEFNQFKPASKITEADKKNDVKSLSRKLDSHLLLLVNTTLGEKKHWLLPQTKRQDGETMREAADRCIKEFCGDVNAVVLGNAPFGFYKYKYPKSMVSDSVGAKVFFFKVLHISGDVNVPKNCANDFQWSTRQEMTKLLSNYEYLKSVSLFLVDEDEEQDVKR